MGLIQQFIFPFDFRGFHDFFHTFYYIIFCVEKNFLCHGNRSIQILFEQLFLYGHKSAIIRRVAIIGIVMQRKITENLVFHGCQCLEGIFFRIQFAKKFCQKPCIR